MAEQSDDLAFIEKRELYCRNQCNFKLEPVESEGTEAYSKHIKILVYCAGCGMVDDLETGIREKTDEPTAP